MKHLDLFSGIGGFALAVDTVWPGSEHTFVEYDKFCQAVLAKHWPNSKIHGDIRTFITDTEHDGQPRTKEIGTYSSVQPEGTTRAELPITKSSGSSPLRKTESRWDILTGGFPCQPFSQAGRRKGTSDNRYLWPEMFRVIQLTQPTYVIAENVRGLATWDNGVVLEQVCTDLESEGYDVQPLIIPAVAVNAPHRRDRVWIIGYAHGNGRTRREKKVDTAEGGEPTLGNASGRHRTGISNASDTTSKGRGEPQKNERREVGNNRSWNESWIEVATELCRVDDELSARVDRPEYTLSAPAHRRERLKSLGNAIVPAVAVQIMRSIQSVDDVL